MDCFIKNETAIKKTIPRQKQKDGEKNIIEQKVDYL